MAEVGTKLKAILELDATQFQKQIDKCGADIQKLGEKGVSSEGADKIFAELSKGLTDYNAKIGKTVQMMVGGLEKNTKAQLTKVTNTSKKQITKLQSQIESLSSPKQEAIVFDKWATGIKKVTDSYKNLATIEHKGHQETIAELKLEMADEKHRHSLAVEDSNKEILASKKLADIKYKSAQSDLMAAKAKTQANQAALVDAKKLNQESLINTRKANLEYKKQRDIIKDNQKAIEKAEKAKEKAIKKAEKARKKAEKDAEKARKKLIARIKAPFKAFGITTIVLNQFKELLGSILRGMKSLWDYTYGQIIKVNAEMENFMVRLKVVSGSALAAKSIFLSTIGFAKTVTFTLRETMESATALLPVLAGGKSELKKWLPVIADISATFGLTFQETTANFVKAYSAGIAAADLFRERGITAAMSFTPGQFYSVRETREGIYNAWASAGSIFRGASEELSSTWNGIMSKLEDRWNIFVQHVGNAGIFSKLKSNLQDVLNAFDYLYDKTDKDGVSLLDRLANNVSRIMSNLFEVLKTFFINFLEWVSGLDFFESMFKSIKQKNLESKLSKLRKEQSRLVLKHPIDAIMSSGDLQKRFDSLNSKIVETSEELKKVKANDPFAEMKSSIKSINNDLERTKKLAGAYKITRSERESRSAGRMFFQDETRIKREQAKIKGVLLEGSQEISKVSNQYIAKSLKETEGEWAGTLQSIDGKVTAFAKKMKANWEKQGFIIDPDLLNDPKNMIKEFNKQIEKMRKTLTSNEMLAQAGKYQEKINTAQLELKNLGMPAYQQKYNKILAEYVILLKNAAPSNKQQAEDYKRTKIAILDKTKALTDNINAMKLSMAIEQTRYSKYEQYSAQIAAIESKKKIDIKEFGNEKAIENYTASMEMFNASLEKMASGALVDTNVQLSKIGKNASEIAAIDLANKIKPWKDALTNVPVNSPLARSIRKVIDNMKELNEDTHPEGFVSGWNKGLQDFRTNLGTTGDDARKLSSQIASDMSSSMSDGFFKILEGDIKGLQDVLGGFVKSFIKAMIDIQTAKMAAGITTGISKLFTPSQANTSPAGWNPTFVGVPTSHDGGIVGNSGWGSNHKMVDPSIFSGAPRFHNGLRSDEFPAILQKGEEVIPKKGWTNSNKSSDIDIRIHNESNEALQVKRTEQQQDVSGMILDVWIDGFTRNKKGMRTMLGG